MDGFFFPRAWKNTLEETIEKRGKIMVIGEIDRGKTTLCQYLLKEFLEKEATVAYMDADVGQSVLGPPTTIGASIFTHFPDDFHKILPDFLWFVGSTSPAYYIPEVITGTGKLLQEIEKKNVKSIIVDTSGLIKGKEGKRLKFFKALLLEPDSILYLYKERDREEECIKLLEKAGFMLRRLRVGEYLKNKERMQRIDFRKNKFKRYFSGSKVLSLCKKEMVFSSSPVLLRKGQLLGLIEEGGLCLGLGLYIQERENEISILTPLKNIDNLRIIWVGELCINPETGEEI